MKEVREALERLFKESNRDFGCEREEQHKKDKSLIEKELEDYYSNKVLIDNIDSNKVAFLPSDELKALIDKEQVLKIIIKKRVDIYLISHCSNLGQYNLKIRHNYYLTEADFNLIKEAISQWED